MSRFLTLAQGPTGSKGRLNRFERDLRQERTNM
jgi:hypothetical protein